MASNPAQALKRRTVRAVVNSEWMMIERYLAKQHPDVVGIPTGVAGAILAQDLAESRFHLRICCRGNRPKGDDSQTLVKLIRRFNGAQFALFDVLFNYGARGILHDVNGPTGVHYSANQSPIGSFSEAAWLTGRVFYLHLLGESDSEAYQHASGKSGPGPWLNGEACVAKWSQIAPDGFEILEPVDVLRLATGREVVKAYASFKETTTPAVTAATPTQGGNKPSREQETTRTVRGLNVQKVQGTERCFKIDRKPPVTLSKACATLFDAFIALIESNTPATPANLMAKLSPRYNSNRKRFEDDKGRFNDALEAVGIAKGLYVVGDVFQLCKPPKKTPAKAAKKNGIKTVRRR